MDRRTTFANGLHPTYLPLYQALCTILPPRWQPYYGIRTFDEQAKLFAQGRTTPGKTVTDASPGQSAHNYGCASDWILWDASNKPIWLPAGDPAWKEYSDACKQAGARWGIQIKSGIDSPHNELPISCKWSDVYDQYLLDGLPKAMEFVAAQAVQH